MSRLLVIGESCVDVFSYGECDRLCPAAPVPVFRATETKKHLKKESGGMAMNVYANMLSLGANAEIYTNDTWKEISKQDMWIIEQITSFCASTRMSIFMGGAI